MWRIHGTSIEPIGLDIGYESIKMLQVVVQGERLAVHAAARRAFPPESRQQPETRLAVAMDFVRQMLREGGFSGRRVIAAVPRHLLHVKNVRLPVMPPAELDSAMRFEARGLFKFDTDNALIQCIPAGEVRQGNDSVQEVIVLAAERERLDPFVEQLHHTGLLVDSLDAEPCALYRGMERFVRRREDEQEVYALVDIGWSATHVVIGRGHDITFLKTIDIGGKNLDEAVMRRLELPNDEAHDLRKRHAVAVADSAAADPVRQAVIDSTRAVLEQLGKEISLCLRYQSVTFRGMRPARLRLLGGEGGDQRIQSVLATVLTIPVEPAQPLYSVSSAAIENVEHTSAMGEWAVAFGLSLRHTKGKFRPLDGKPRERMAVPVESPTAAADAAAASPASTEKGEPVHA